MSYRILKIGNSKYIFIDPVALRTSCWVYHTGYIIQVLFGEGREEIYEVASSIHGEEGTYLCEAALKVRAH